MNERPHDYTSTPMQTLLQSGRTNTQRFPNRQLDVRLADARRREVVALLDAFRKANAAASPDRPQHDKYVTRLMNRIQVGSLRVVDHVLVLARNWFERNAPRAEVEAPFRLCLDIIESWYPAPPDDMHELKKRETMAQGPADVAAHDIETAHGPELADAIKTLRTHRATLDDLIEAAERKYLAELPPAA